MRPQCLGNFRLATHEFRSVADEVFLPVMLDNMQFQERILEIREGIEVRRVSRYVWRTMNANHWVDPVLGSYSCGAGSVPLVDASSHFKFVDEDRARRVLRSPRYMVVPARNRLLRYCRVGSVLFDFVQDLGRALSVISTSGSIDKRLFQFLLRIAEEFPEAVIGFQQQLRQITIQAAVEQLMWFDGGWSRFSRALKRVLWTASKRFREVQNECVSIAPCLKSLKDSLDDDDGDQQTLVARVDGVNRKIYFTDVEGVGVYIVRGIQHQVEIVKEEFKGASGSVYAWSWRVTCSGKQCYVSQFGE